MDHPRYESEDLVYPQMSYSNGFIANASSNRPTKKTSGYIMQRDDDFDRVYLDISADYAPTELDMRDYTLGAARKAIARGKISSALRSYVRRRYNTASRRAGQRRTAGRRRKPARPTRRRRG